MGVLISESLDDVSTLITESKESGKKKYIIEGIFLQAGIKNRNGRIYDPGMLDREVNRYVTERVNTLSAIGEMGHPPTPALSHERASHLIESLEREGNNYIGRARILTSLPMGKIAKGLIDEGVRFGVSSRGVGGLVKGTNIVEVRNYKMTTAADIVTDPSAPDAWVNGIMENAEWCLDAAGEWVSSPEYNLIKEQLDRPKRLVSESTKLRLFNQFLNKIATKN